MQAVLQAHQLSIGYRYRQETLVRANISLNLEAGHLQCLMGPNGAGKSTLLRTLAGVQAPLAGELRLLDQPMQKLSVQERARLISLVLTDPLHSANLRVLEVVQLGRYPHTGWFGTLSAADKEAVERAMTDTEIIALADRKIYSLSDGQRQKVMIARALAQGGALLLLDEPTAHLDLVHRIQIMHLLKTVARKQQKAVVVATHELDLALQTADSLLLMPQEAALPLRSGLPEDLVLNGALEQAFGRPPFLFDQQSGRFYQPLPQQNQLQLQGAEPARFWTAQLLQRHGYALSSQAAARVEVQYDEGKWHWHYHQGEVSEKFSTLAALLQALGKFH